MGRKAACHHSWCDNPQDQGERRGHICHASPNLVVHKKKRRGSVIDSYYRYVDFENGNGALESGAGTVQVAAWKDINRSYRASR